MDTINQVLIKAKGFESLSLPLLLHEDYDQTDVRTFTEALYDCIVQKQDLKVIRLASEELSEVKLILEVLSERFKPVLASTPR